MRTIYKIPAYISFTFALATVSATTIATSKENTNSHQHNDLHQPGTSQLHLKSKRLVYIDDGFAEKTIAQAMQQPEKIKSTVLVNSKKTDKSSNLPPSQEAGGIPQEEDDC